MNNISPENQFKTDKRLLFKMRNCLFFGLFVCLSLLTSCKSAKLKDAIACDEREEYFEASQIYRKVYSKTSPQKKELRGEIAFAMAEDYRKINNPNRAVSAYANAIRYQYADSTAILHQAQMLQKLGRYPEAIKSYNLYLEKDSMNSLAKNGILGSNLAMEWQKNPMRHTVKKLDKFNSRDGDFRRCYTEKCR